MLRQAIPDLKKTLCRSALSTLRKRCKLAIVVSWFVEEVGNFKPSKPSDLTDFVKMATKKMKDKGVGKLEIA